MILGVPILNHFRVSRVLFDYFQVIDVSGAEHLRKRLPDCRRVDIIPRCGHSVGTDRPGAMTKLIKLFRKDTEADR